MFSNDNFIGCTKAVEDLRNLNETLNDEVLDQINDSQELALLNRYAKETNEYVLQHCLKQRISDIASWRWVFEDLSKRLSEAIEALNYELNALRVIVERIEGEIAQHSRLASRPGAMQPLTDAVENHIMNEYKFLQAEKKNFEKMSTELEKQIKTLERTKKRIMEDILMKQEALSVENLCANVEMSRVLEQKDGGKRKRRRFSSLAKWENRCACLKRVGLQALNNAVITRQQVRGARVGLSISSQAHSSKVDAALRRRLHSNIAKLEELRWQREEAIQDMKCLDEELLAADQNLLETMDQERLVLARIEDRAHRPVRELTKDEVDRRLKDELGRLRHFMKRLRSNISRITHLQNRLTNAVTSIDCHVEDISQLVTLDQYRVNQRTCDCKTETRSTGTAVEKKNSASSNTNMNTLNSIKEEDEDEYGDDYPLNY